MLYPPPGQTITAALLSLTFPPRNTVIIGLETLPSRMTPLPDGFPSLGLVMSRSSPMSPLSPGATSSQRRVTAEIAARASSGIESAGEASVFGESTATAGPAHNNRTEAITTIRREEVMFMEIFAKLG